MVDKADKGHSALYRLRKLVLRPLWKLRDYIYPQKYRPEQYWKARHQKHGFAVRGVGDWTRSEEENVQEYSMERSVFLDFCRKHGIDFSKVSMLDVGCGTGFFAEAFRDNGGTDYLGIDITDELFEGLAERLPGFRFKKMDVGRQKLEGKYDLIIMISVAQHIVDEKCFTFAMQNIREHLSESGTFIVTVWQTDVYVHPQPHVVGRPVSYFQREFEGYWFSEPEPFGTKNLYAVRKQ
ncbi:MAG: class I SAM-dependent methyltransferase [Phycisphaerae bacterium]|nr:class I SAM-dependent methyltransferase [Phycisphaerae bacterium]